MDTKSKTYGRKPSDSSFNGASQKSIYHHFVTIDCHWSPLVVVAWKVRRHCSSLKKSLNKLQLTFFERCLSNNQSERIVDEHDVSVIWSRQVARDVIDQTIKIMWISALCRTRCRVRISDTLDDPIEDQRSKSHGDPRDLLTWQWLRKLRMMDVSSNRIFHLHQ